MGAAFDTQNMGVSALAAGAIKCVLSQYPGAQVSFLDYSRESKVYTLTLNGSRVSVPLVNIRFSKKVYLSNHIVVLALLAVLLKWTTSTRFRSWILTRNRCLRELYKADLVAAISGGDSFSDIYGWQRLLYVSLPQVVTILLGKKLVQLPQTIGPFRAGLSRVVARYVLRGSEKIYARDYRSLEAVERLLGKGCSPGKCSFCYDVGFVLDPVAPSRVDIRGISLNNDPPPHLIGLNVSGLLMNGHYARPNRFGLKLDYRELIESLISLLIEEKGAVVLLIPHVFGAAANSESDSMVCENLFESWKGRYPGRLGVVEGTLNQSEIKHVIGCCEFFVGSRMHACIAALSQTVPAMAIAYSDKFLGVMETLGIQAIVTDARKMQKAEILEAIGQAYDCRQGMRELLASKMPAVRKSALGLFRQVAGVPEEACDSAIVGIAESAQATRV